MKKWKVVLATALLVAAAFGQRKEQTSQTISASGQTVSFNDGVGAVTTSFEYLINGSPTTISIVTSGCMRGGTCSVLNTSTSTSNSVYTASGAYDYYTVSATWTGGTSPSVQVNRSSYTARLGNGSGGIFGTPTPGDCASFASTTQIQDAGSPCVNSLNLTNVVAAYDMLTTSSGGTVLNDVSGANACTGAPANATFGASAPVITSYGALFTASTSQTFNLPTCLNSSIVAAQIVAEGTVNAFNTNLVKLVVGSNGSFNVTHYMSGASAGGFSTLALNYVPTIYLSGAPTVIPGVGCFGVCDYAWVKGAANASKVFVNGVESPFYHTAVTGASSSITGPYTIGGSAAFKGTVYYAIFYSAAPTSLQIQQNYVAVKNILASRGIVVNNYGQRQFQVNAGSYNAYTPTHGNPYLLVLGDSISVGLSTTTGPGGVTPWQTTAQGDLTGPLAGLTFYNFGAMGYKTLGQIAGEINSWYPQLIDPPNNTSLPIAMGTVVLFEGTNDVYLNGAETAIQTYSKLRYDGQYLRGLGFKVVFVPAISRTTVDARIQAFDAMALAHCSEFADVCADPSDPAVYSFMYATGAYSNATYFQADGIHPTAAGQALLGHMIAKAMNKLFTPTFESNISVALTAQTAAVASTQWLNTTHAPAGTYRVCGNVQTTTVSGTGSPTLTVALSYTDEVGAQTPNLITGFSLSALGSAQVPCTQIRVASGTLNYSTTIVSAAGTPQYSLYLNIERIP